MLCVVGCMICGACRAMCVGCDLELFVVACLLAVCCCLTVVVCWPLFLVCCCWLVVVG